MGYKNIKEHYHIGHYVAVYEGEGICIGSAYVHNLLTILPDGEVKWGIMGPSKNDDLARYHSEMTADKTKLVELINAPDIFTKNIPVFTYDGGNIIEKQCEQPGWPNTTHDGDMMYQNTFSTDKKKVVEWAKRNARLAIESQKNRVQEIVADLEKMESYFEKSVTNLQKLEADYPET